MLHIYTIAYKRNFVNLVLEECNDKEFSTIQRKRCALNTFKASQNSVKRIVFSPQKN